MSAPPPYRTVCPYLAVPEAEAVANFAREVFGAELVAGPMRSEEDGRLLHMALRIGDSVVMLGAPPEEEYRQTAMLHVYVESCDASYRAALAAGAREMMAPRDMFYGDRAGGVHDVAGNLWWIAERLPEKAGA